MCPRVPSKGTYGEYCCCRCGDCSDDHGCSLSLFDLIEGSRSGGILAANLDLSVSEFVSSESLSGFGGVGGKVYMKGGWVRISRRYKV